jgi:cytochrome c oxidase subunit 7
MPFAPITGKLRKRLWLDLSCALGLGISSAYAYWSVVVVFLDLA